MGRTHPPVWGRRLAGTNCCKYIVRPLPPQGPRDTRSLPCRRLPAALGAGGPWEALSARCTPCIGGPLRTWRRRRRTARSALAEQAGGHDVSFTARSLNDLAALHPPAAATTSPSRCTSARWRCGSSLGERHPEVAQSLNNLALLRASGAIHRRRMAVPAGGWSIHEKRSARSTPSSPPSSTTWRCCSRPEASWRRPGRSTAGARDPREGVRPGEPRSGAEPAHAGGAARSPKATASVPSPVPRSLAIREGAFGPFHGDVAMSLNVLAMLCAARDGRRKRRPTTPARSPSASGSWAASPRGGAEPAQLRGCCIWPRAGTPGRGLFGRALLVRQKALGKDHPLVARTLRTRCLRARPGERSKRRS